MKPKYSLAHLTALKCPPPELIYIADLCGYDYASLRPIGMHLPGEPDYVLAEDKELLRQTKQALEDTGIQVHDIELARILDDVDVSSYESALEVGAELGARSILSSIWTKDKNRYMEQFTKLVELAKPYGLNVDLEFVTWASVFDLKTVMEVLNAQTETNIGVMIDMLHFHRSRVALEELDQIPKEWFHFVHLCDAPKEIPELSDVKNLAFVGRHARLYPGEGYADIAGIMSGMPEDIVCSIELPHTERSRILGFAEHARRCLKYSRQYMETHF